ncbi:MAG: hypothetical protein K2Y01_10570 [Rhabdochlamydiaceae bacterium]|nr:hypothetical protein [Rhabdochlamydiaceae bacterium]
MKNPSFEEPVESPRTDTDSVESKESMSKGPSPRTDCDYNSDSDVDVEDMGYFG